MVEEVARLGVEMARHDERLKDTEKWREKQNGALERIANDLQTLTVNWSKRPTWMVASVIGGLMSLCSAMGVYIIFNM